MLDTSALENIFDSVGQSMLQLARAQDQTNRQLQQCIQQGQANMQAHTGTLQLLATSIYQRNFDHMFVSIPIYDGSDREGFFPWLEHLEAACFHSGKNIKTEALSRSGRTCPKCNNGSSKCQILEAHQRGIKEVLL